MPTKTRKPAVKKPAVKTVEVTETVSPAVVSATEPAQGAIIQPATPAPVINPVPAEDKPKIILAPEVEAPKEEAKPAETSTETDKTSGEAKTEMPAGELARSLDALSKIGVADEHLDETSRAGGETVGKKSGKTGGGGVLGMALAFVIGFGLGIIAGYLLWGQYVVGGVKLTVEKETRRNETPVIQAMPTATPAAELKRTDLKLKVLNGSGGRGVAAAAKVYLEELGYTEITLGNAESSDYDQTEVVLSPDKIEYWPLLKGDLAGEYTIAEGFTTDAEVLEKHGGVDAVIIIGK